MVAVYINVQLRIVNTFISKTIKYTIIPHSSLLNSTETNMPEMLMSPFANQVTL